jgi:hypothetical protein
MFTYFFIVCISISTLPYIESACSDCCSTPNEIDACKNTVCCGYINNDFNHPTCCHSGTNCVNINGRFGCRVPDKDMKKQNIGKYINKISIF